MAAVQRKVRSVSSSQVSIEDMLPSWERQMRARNLTPQSVEAYLKRMRRFVRWLVAESRSLLVAAISKATILDYLAAAVAEGAAPKSVQDYHGACHVFFDWLVEEGEIPQSPMDTIHTPKVPKKPVPLLDDEELLDLLRTCEGTDFMARRDAAILRLIVDTGLRRGELTRLLVADVDLIRMEATLHGKGRKDYTVVFRSKTATALGRYLRIRGRHVDAQKADLWLGAQGPLTADGLYRIVKKRATQANIRDKVWPHKIRHNAVDQWLEEGGQEHAGAIMFGWESTDQFKRYGAARAEERAREAAKKMKGGDRL